MRGAFLRPWRGTDAAALVVACAADDVVRQLGGFRPDGESDAARFIADTLTVAETAAVWAIDVAGIAVGGVGVGAIEHRHDTGWAHYWVREDQRGRGLAAAALVAAVRWAFDERGLFRIELGHRVNNPASGAVALRAGFVPEGLERAKLRYGDERYDVRTYARLRTDPEPDIRPLPFAAD